MCVNVPTPSPLTLLVSVAALFGRAAETRSDPSLALLPCKTWLHFHSGTESDFCCPASSNASSSANTEQVLLQHIHTDRDLLSQSEVLLLHSYCLNIVLLTTRHYVKYQNSTSSIIKVPPTY